MALAFNAPPQKCCIPGTVSYYTNSFLKTCWTDVCTHIIYIRDLVSSPFYLKTKTETKPRYIDIIDLLPGFLPLMVFVELQAPGEIGQ